MDRELEHAALVVLLTRPRAPWAAVAAAVEEAGSALRVLERGLQPDGQERLFPSGQSWDEELDEAARKLQAWQAEGLSFVSLLDSGYPTQLLEIHQRPPFLMSRGGQLDSFGGGVAIVGTRQASENGLRQARSLALGITARQVPVVSGLAAGIDTAALEAATEAGGRPVGVIGTGLHRSYPTQNARLQDRVAHDGVVISQFFPDAPPTKTSFPMRNAVMSGYAAATVVVEAAWRSGARMQARLALEHGRPVFLMSSLLEHDWARDYAERPGVTVVKDAEDVLARLGDVLQPVDELTWA